MVEHDPQWWCSVCDPAKILFLASSGFIYFFSCNLTQTVETETANRWETTPNSKPPGRIIMIDQSETGRSSEIVFITLFFTTLCCVLYQPQQSVQTSRRENHFPWDKPACFDFSSCHFNVQGHILSIAGMLWSDDNLEGNNNNNNLRPIALT